jgi:hypothetical protein
MAKNIVPKDFVFNSDRTHARLSKRGVASLLKVDEKSIRNAMKSADLIDCLSPEVIAGQGFEGADLVRLIQHFVMSSKVKTETRLHCADLLGKMAIVGAQIFIDSLAGIDPAQPQPCRILDQIVRERFLRSRFEMVWSAILLGFRILFHDTD